ncbi:PH-domain-containing protein [Pseudovirgaria hyperparasitica]|uniref:PH-domain-containing protein n=1 Tax=Pseudovirgaria hyperparasitica TaxID=470096 RepID=A0A6A6WLB9_9PEZI|nr:PH-domain-containing protein [Pseudovirgaria hyperparasitica]KAF2762799.1 PH-domain-containing protein [Pseudovirgaria hyperparasitica]
MATSATASKSNDRDVARRVPYLDMKLPPPQDQIPAQPGMHGLQVFSPVNQNGSFDFDRVLKQGQILKRTRRTKSWKTIYIVLRPNVLSLYKDADATKLRHQINLSELTAVARQKDPKGKNEYVFALFTPSRNFHLAAKTEKEAQDWVELVRTEARIDEDEEDMILTSPTGQKDAFQGFERSTAGIVSSSSEDMRSSSRQPIPIPQRTGYSNPRNASYTANYSGNEQGSYSDFSDTAGPGGVIESNLSLSNPNNAQSPNTKAQAVYGVSNTSNTTQRKPSNQHAPRMDSERVVCQGWLYLLKSKRGVRQWKKLWVVLRAKTLAFYKDQSEYSANLIVPFHNITDVVEIDPVSKTKIHCMQIISEERNYRCCATDEDGLFRWLGAFKSLLVKRKEEQKSRSASKNTSDASTAPSSEPHRL